VSSPRTTPHPETWLALHQLGTLQPYRHTYDFRGRYLNLAHRRLARPAWGRSFLLHLRARWWTGPYIPGFLQHADALKLYELAYFAGGDALELGSWQGLSTSILARALRDAERAGRAAGRLTSIELDPAHAETTRATLSRMRLAERVEVRRADAVQALDELAREGRAFSLAFVDHDHGYDAVAAVCARLGAVLRPGAFLLFHDFNDPRNADEGDPEYGVYQAVRDGLDAQAFDFYGVYGCAALYRRAHGSARPGSPPR
jgi:predicted O-methyltransferase YrrM